MAKNPLFYMYNFIKVFYKAKLGELIRFLNSKLIVMQKKLYIYDAQALGILNIYSLWHQSILETEPKIHFLIYKIRDFFVKVLKTDYPWDE